MDNFQTAPRTADQLRGRIDHGATGEKVDWPDPAASPLGTDEEAGGHPATKQQLEMETPSLNDATPRRFSIGAVVTYVAIAAILLAVFSAIILLS